jgi:hypothetical protein
MRGAMRGLVRVSGGTLAAPDWSALRGKAFRVYYRAQRDWTLQVYRPPASFWFSASPDALGWDRFSLDMNATDRVDWNQLYVPRVYQGQSVAADYAYWDDRCRALGGTTTETVDVTSTERLRPGLRLKVINPTEPPTIVPPKPFTPPTVAGIVEVASVDSPNRITLVAAATNPIKTGAYFVIDREVDSDAKLLRASGEVHAVAEDPGNSARGTFKLQHLPAYRTPVTVRGVSVTVRAMWIQGRGGSAYTVTNQPGTAAFGKRPMNEQWQAKTLTLILPATQE